MSFSITLTNKTNKIFRKFHQQAINNFRNEAVNNKKEGDYWTTVKNHDVVDCIHYFDIVYIAHAIRLPVELMILI